MKDLIFLYVKKLTQCGESLCKNKREVQAAAAVQVKVDGGLTRLVAEPDKKVHGFTASR